MSEQLKFVRMWDAESEHPGYRDYLIGDAPGGERYCQAEDSTQWRRIPIDFVFGNYLCREITVPPEYRVEGLVYKEIKPGLQLAIMTAVLYVDSDTGLVYGIDKSQDIASETNTPGYKLDKINAVPHPGHVLPSLVKHFGSIDPASPAGSSSVTTLVEVSPERPKWTVCYNIVSPESRKWVGTGWEFFDNQPEAEDAVQRHEKLGNSPTKRPYFPSTDDPHLGAAHRMRVTEGATNFTQQSEKAFKLLQEAFAESRKAMNQAQFIRGLGSTTLAVPLTERLAKAAGHFAGGRFFKEEQIADVVKYREQQTARIAELEQQIEALQCEKKLWSRPIGEPRQLRRCRVGDVEYREAWHGLRVVVEVMTKEVKAWAPSSFVTLDVALARPGVELLNYETGEPLMPKKLRRVRSLIGLEYRETASGVEQLLTGGKWVKTNIGSLSDVGCDGALAELDYETGQAIPPQEDQLTATQLFGKDVVSP